MPTTEKKSCNVDCAEDLNISLCIFVSLLVGSDVCVKIC